MMGSVGLHHTTAGALVCLLALSFAACGHGGTLPPEGPRPDSVSVGYGTEARASVTGAVSSVPAADLTTPGFTRIDQLLEHVSGIEVTRRSDGDFTVRIRGARSLLANNDPLLVIDGSPVPAGGFQAALAGLAPAEVSSIDVLKDAGATAAYGIQGANGVILVTTRRGR